MKVTASIRPRANVEKWSIGKGMLSISLVRNQRRFSVGRGFIISLLATGLLFAHPPVLFDTVIGIQNFVAADTSVRLAQDLESSKGVREAIEEIEEGPFEQNAYRFDYTSLGFGLKDLSFIESLPKDEIEERLYRMLPEQLQKNAKRYIRAVLILSQKYQVDPIWVLSVMWTESHFKHTATSHVGARGLMQVMPATKRYIYSYLRKKGHTLEAEKIGFNINNFFSYSIEKPEIRMYTNKLVNIEIGIFYLKNLLKFFHYNHRHATVAYNMGPGWTQKRLRDRMPVGVKNEYLDKVTRAYTYLVRNI